MQYDGAVKSIVLYPQLSGAEGDREIRAYLTIKVLNLEAWGKSGRPKLDESGEITGSRDWDFVVRAAKARVTLKILRGDELHAA